MESILTLRSSVEISAAAATFLVSTMARLHVDSVVSLLRLVNLDSYKLSCFIFGGLWQFGVESFFVVESGGISL